MHDVLTARGAVQQDHPTKIEGRSWAICWAITPTSEKPRTSAGLYAKSVKKGHCMILSIPATFRDVAGGTPNRRCRRDDLPSEGKRGISHRWIPVVERPREVLHA